MACNIRRAVISRVKEQLLKQEIGSINPRNVVLKFNKNSKDIELHLPVANNIKSELIGDIDGVNSVTENADKKTKKLVLTLCKSKFVSQVVNEISKEPQVFWRKSDLFDDFKQQKVLVEFSSPNIAKPFHMGHLRSTIVGNFVSNLHSALGNSVVRINYLGDWGTQFGLLNVGLEMGKVTDSDIAKNPIQNLYDAYVAANKAAEANPEINDKAREIFRQLEDGSFKEIERWEKFRGYTVSELQTTYARLGVKFDEYQWESMFGARQINHVLDSLRNCGLLVSTPDGRQVAKVGEDRSVTIVKSDGSTLYLTRDIAAALYRYEQHHFDQLLYVVDNSQSDHFTALRHLLAGMGHSWGERGIRHVKFGRIRGMSTRRGQVVFLRDILDEARERVAVRQQQSTTTRSDLCEDTSDVLAVSAVVVNDLKQRRQRDYEFNWDTALQMQGDTGLRLQYTHCRLCSLEERSSVSPATECNAALLTEPEACALVTELARFDQVLDKSYTELEACVLVNYLFALSILVNQAFQKLQVKGQPDDVASQRLLLFRSARQVLGHGLSILGIQPLSKM